MTNIEWTHFPGYTGKSWNPVTGCQKVASGCKNCYAEALAKRFWKDRDFADVRTHADRLDQPLRARKPTCWFVNSMSDLFHEAVPDNFIAQVYAMMARSRAHLYIVLTKRAKRMQALLASPGFKTMVSDAIDPEWRDSRRGETIDGLPLPNVIHGYSASTQADLDAGMPDLMQVPSALHMLSAEPLLGDLDLGPALEGLDWVVVGGESGPGARPCNVAWIRSIVQQCKAAGVPCFVKQLGSRPAFDGMRYESTQREWGAEFRCKDPKGGDPSEWPADLRVRQFPALGVTHG